MAGLLIALSVTVLMVAAGAAVALTWQPGDPADGAPAPSDPLEHVVLALGWSFGLVPFLAFTWTLFTRDPLTPGVVAWTSGGTLLAALGIWQVRFARRVPAALGREHWRPAIAVLGACVAVALLYFLKYDRSVFWLKSCIHVTVLEALQLRDPPIDLLRVNFEDQRLGNTGVISSFVALYRQLGPRVLYSLVGGFMTLGGFVLGSRVFGNRAAAWFLALFLPLNPYVLKLPLLDENLLTLSFSALVLPLVFVHRSRIPWGHVGALFGLVVMMRHVMVLSAPALLWIGWRQARSRPSGFAWASFGFLAVTWVGLAHHTAALGSPLMNESFGQFDEPFAHRFVGDWFGLLQWPFAERIVRTPWNPLPTFLMWPVFFAGHVGLVLWSATGVGVVALLRRNRTAGVFFGLWFGPLWAFLSAQENWDVGNKMGVIYIVFVSLGVWTAAGLAELLQAPRRVGPAMLAVVVLSAAAMLGARSLEVPPDERYYRFHGDTYPHLAAAGDELDYSRAERRRVTAVRLWPDLSRLSESTAFLDARKLGGLLHDLRNPQIEFEQTPYGFHPGERFDADAPPVLLTIDLTANPFASSAPWIRLAAEGAEPDIDLTAAGPASIVVGAPFSWDPRPPTIFVSPGQAPVAGLMLSFKDWSEDRAPPETEDDELFLREYLGKEINLMLGWDTDTFVSARDRRLQGSTLTLRVRPGPLGFVQSVNIAGQLFLAWRVDVGPDGALQVSGPHRAFHN